MGTKHAVRHWLSGLGLSANDCDVSTTFQWPLLLRRRLPVGATDGPWVPGAQPSEGTRISGTDALYPIGVKLSLSKRRVQGDSFALSERIGKELVERIDLRTQAGWPKCISNDPGGGVLAVAIPFGVKQSVSYGCVGMASLAECAHQQSLR